MNVIDRSPFRIVIERGADTKNHALDSTVYGCNARLVGRLSGDPGAWMIPGACFWIQRTFGQQVWRRRGYGSMRFIPAA